MKCIPCTVGADFHIRPKVPFCTTETATRHQIMVTVNEMDRMDCPYRNNALGRIYKSAPTVCMNFMDEWIDCASTRRMVIVNLVAHSGWNCAGRYRKFDG